MGDSLTCNFCQKIFKYEKAFGKHMCRNKSRFSEKDEKHVRIGLLAFNKFFQSTQHNKKPASYEEFVKSKYYNGFVQFGRYVADTKCIEVHSFIDWIIKKNVRLDKWNKDSTYTAFLYNFLRNESVNMALTRGIEFSIKWGDENNESPYDILRKCSETSIAHYVNTGKISAWLLYNSESGKEFLSNLSTHNTHLIYDCIDPVFWQNHFESRESDVTYSTAILKQAGW